MVCDQNENDISSLREALRTSLGDPEVDAFVRGQILNGIVGDEPDLLKAFYEEMVDLEASQEHRVGDTLAMSSYRDDRILHLLASSYGLQTGQIAVRLEISLSAVERKVHRMLDSGWLVAIPDQAVKGYMINPDFPGIIEYLSWMSIRYGTRFNCFRVHAEYLRSLAQ